MNIDTTATNLQVSPASATRAEVAAPQTGGAPSIGFAQLLAALLSAATPAPAVDSQPIVATADHPDASESKKPADPATSFDGIFAIFGSAPPQPVLTQLQTSPAQATQAPVTPLLRTDGSGPPVSPALVAGIASTTAAATASPIAANLLDQNAATSPEPGPNPLPALVMQFCPTANSGSQDSVNKSGQTVPQTLTSSDVGATPQVNLPATTPAQGLNELPDVSSSANAQPVIADVTPPSPQSGKAPEFNAQSTNGSGTPGLGQFSGETSGLPSTVVVSTGSAGKGLVNPNGWSIPQFHLTPAEAGPRRNLVEALARKFSASAGSFIQELVQRSSQGNSSVVAGSGVSQQQGDGQSFANAEPKTVTLPVADQTGAGGIVQNQTDLASQVVHSGVTTEPMQHHGTTTLAQLPHRLTEIVTSRLEQPHSADQSSVVLRLDPPELGRVTVHVSMANDVISIRLVASDDGSRQLLETHLNDLQQSLSDQGVSLNHCQVECNTGDGQSSDRSRHWPIPGEMELFPSASRPTPAVANVGAQIASRTKLDYVA